MALSLDDYKRIAADAHPDWNDAQKEQWAQSKVGGGSGSTQQDKEEEGRWGLLSGLADWGRKAGTSISGWFDDLISDETAENSTIGKLGDMALNVVGGVLGGAVQSIAETPNFVGNIVSMPFTDKSEWGWSDVKNRARELQDDYGMNRAGAWLTAIDENNNSEHVGAQTIFQLLNNPLLGKGIGKGLDIVGGAIKGTGKTAQVVGKVANVADDAAKVSKGVKVAGAAEEVIEDTTKTAGKTSILSKIKNGYDKTKNYLKETTIGTKLKDAGVNTARFIGGPITDAYDILKVGVKTTRTAMKSSGVGSSLMEGLRATLGETVQTAGKFISKPLSYRTPRLWTTSTADMLLGDNVERGFAAGDKGDFRDEYGYSIDLVSYLNDDELQQYYDKNNIPQNKRLTADQIKEKQSQMGQNMFSDFTEGAKNLYEMFDIFSAPSFIMEQRRNNPGEVEVERNVRGEFRGFSNGKSINFSTGEVRDADGKAINLEDLTADELKEVGLLYEQKQAEEMGEGTPYTWSQKTGIKSNNITNVINNYAVNGMLTDTAENLVMTSDNAGVRANAVYINNQLNEASKEYVNSIIANYTVDEINSNPQLQEEIRRSLDAYSLLFNTTADYISRMDDKEYDDVYRFKKALTSAYNLLDDDSKDLIDSNLYRKSIDYNNNLESGFDKFWMKSATWVKRSTDKMLNMFWSSDTNEWFEQGLSGLAGGVINPELASRGTAWGEISSGLRSNAAYAVDMVVLNKINDAVVEKFTGNMFDKAIRSNPKLYTKGFNGIKGGVTEMSSEFLENFTDAISMVEDPNTDYDFVTGFLFGMFQGAMAGYASSTDSYTSFKDYLTRPENRNAVLENMGIYVDLIDDPQQKAVMLSIVSQLMDDKSENNLIDIIVNTASQTNNGVENLMQAYALYQVNKMVDNYTNSLVGQVLDEVNSVDEWTPELIQQYFGTETDPTGRRNFNNYNTGKQFVFNSAVINDIKNREENKKEAETIAKTSAAFIKSSFKTAGMSFEEGLNFMAPKINASNGKKVITPIKKTRTVERDIIDQTTGNPIKDTVSIFVKTGEIAFTIGDKLGITSKNDKLFGEKKSRFGLKTTKGFKNKIEVKTTNEDGTEKTETLTMKDYLVKQLNEANLTDEERQFIGTVLFKTTVSGLNPYFKDDGSLTKLGEDFLKQVMPQLEERTSTVDFFVNLASIQTLKEAQVEKSKNDAMKESGANDDPIPTLNIGGQAVEAGTNISNLSDDTELLIEKDGKKATIKDLKNGGITVSDNGRLCTMRIKEDGTLDIIYDEEEEEFEQPFEEEQTQQQQTTPIQQENGTILFAEDQRLDSLSEEEFQKEYDEAEKERKAAWRKYFELEEEIDNSPSTSDTARDQRFDTLVRLEREAYKATNKKKRMEESKARREKNGVPTAVEEVAPTEEDKKLDQQIEEAIENVNIDDIDDETPPPAAPAVQQEATEEEHNEAVQQVQERLNQVWTALPGATGEKIVQNTNPDTMKTTIPVSVYEHDHQDLQGKFVDVKTLLGKWDNLKSYIPYFVRNDQNVEKPINNRFEQFEYPDELKHLTQSQLNTKYYQDQLPKVNIRQKDGIKTYSLVFVGEGPITDIVGVTRKGMRRHNYFRSYALVDFKTERVNVSITSTIRPTWKWNEKLSKRPQALFYNNNRAITISKKDGSPMEGNRVLGFTRASDKQKNGTWGPDNWFISTTVQMERMGESDHDLAFKNKRVFMNAPSNDSDRRGFLYNFETHQVEQVKYDGRNIFTTSDIVFDDNNEIITIGDIDINIADRSYNNPIELKGKTKGLEEHTLQDWFNMLWDKGQTIKADGTTTDMTSNRKKISDVKKEFKEIVKTQNDNVEMVVEQAENTVTEPTESVEETILKNTESFKAGGTQESLFGLPSLDSVKSSVEERLNTIIKISLREREMNDRLDEINDLIKEIESKNLIDQDDLESLNSERIGLEDLLETLSTFQKIVDESEEFETVEQYINSELDRLKEGDTNTIMDMASQYGILESNNADLSSVPWEESTVQEEAVTEEEPETATTDNTTTDSPKSGYLVRQQVLYEANYQWEVEGRIPAVRRSVDGNPDHSFGNPFDGWTRGEYGVAEATRRFYKWLRGTAYQDVNPGQRKWIIDQIKDGSLKGKTVVYYTTEMPKGKANDYGVKEYDDKHPNHAMVLQKFINGEYTIVEPSTSTEAVIVSEGSVQSPNRYVTPQVPMLALPEPEGSRIVSNNGLTLTEKELESIQYGLDRYTRNETMPLPLNGTVALNDERTIFLHRGQFGLYLERQSNPDMKPERVSYVFSSEAGLANFVKNLTSAENILDNLDEEIMPEPSDLLAEEYPSNRVIGAHLLTDKARLEQMVKDCEELGIVLGSLDARALGQIILAYTKSGRGIDEVLEKFASDIPSSNVDEKLVDIMIKKGILSNAGTYGGLSLSQIIAYNYGLKKIKKDQTYKIIKKTMTTLGYNNDYGKGIYGLSNGQYNDFLNLITDYYIQNYLNLDPAAFGPLSKFREKFKAKVEAKLLSSEIYVHKDGTHSALDDQEDVNVFLNLLHIKPKLRKSFVEAAYTDQINAKPPRKPLITLSQYNYLMESDPFITVVGNEEDYQVGPIGSSVLDSINEITEIGEITGGNANRLKLQLLFDIYTYYQGSRKASYEGLVKFLRNKYRYSELSEDNTMRKLIDVLEEDSKLSGTPIHSEGVMMTLRSSNRESYELDPYQNFIKNERGDNSIIDALIILESNDESSFQQIIEYAPKKIKDELYERFQEENSENKSSNIAYRMVSGLLLNNYKVINDLKQESQKDLPKAEGAVRDMLLGFNPMSLVNSAATRVLYNKFGLRGLDLNKGTVILTNNRQNSLGKWMPNFKNVERFPLLPVSSLNDIKADVNVIVPYGVSIPKDSNGYNYNIIRMENAGYHDGALVVGKIGNRVVDFENRMYNIMGLYGLGVIQSDGFTISREHKKIIRDNKTQKSLYWNIFKNNIQPNLGEDFQNITEDKFYNAITFKAMRALPINMLYKCLAAGDMQELIDNSIAVINAVTNNEFKLRSNNTAGRKTIDTYDAINQFSEFISKQSLSNKAKERIAKMFGDFLMIQMKIGEVNIADRRTDFKTTHSRALDELYKLPDINNAQVGGLELWQIFVNGDLTKKEEPTKKQIEDAIIDAEIDKRSISKTIVNKINDREDQIRKLEKQIQDILTEHGSRSSIGEEKIKNKINELYNARQELEDLEEKYEDKRTPEQKKEIADKDKEISKATTERYKLRQKLGNDAAEVKAKNDEIERLSRERADLKKKYVNNYTMEGKLQIEKKKSNISLLEYQLGELEKVYLVSVSKEHKDEIRQLRLKINEIDSEIYDLENELDAINNKNYFQNNYIEYVNEASGVKSTQNLEEVQNSMILTDEAEDQNRIFSGKAMKVLEYIYNNYIKNNAVTVEPGQSQNSENHIVSKDLLGMLIGENTFNNTYKDVTEGNKKSKRYAYSQSDLNQLVGILTSLKKTNAKRFKEVLDDIFRTYEDIGYTYDTPEHLDLIKYKSDVANNPANLYKIFSDLSNDKRFSIQFLEGGKAEKKLNYKDINMDGLLQSASKEYFEGSPYIVRTAEGVENMNKKVKEYHEKYDQYFEGLLPDGVKPSDEQIKGFAKLKSTFDHRKERGKSSSKRKVFAIPGIAGAGKTTMLTAFFRYVNEVGGAQYEVDNIANGKQTSIIYQFSPKEHSAFYRAKADDVFYAKVENKDKGGGEIYIKFKKGDMKDHDSLLKMSDEDVLKGFSNIWGKDAVPALIEKGEGYEKKWLDKRDNQLKSGSYSVWKINEFEIVTDPKEVPANPIIIKGNDGTLSPDASRYQDFPAIESNRALSDIHFAVRMHQTISSLKSTFSNDQKFNGIDYGTEASYMTQANSVNMDLFGYNDSPIVKKQMEGQFIIIDEAQNSYNSDLQAITEQLGGNNVVAMLGDFHQNSKGDFFKNLSKDEQYMVETHRGTEDINIMNEINAFTQNALIKANAVGFYMNDSDDFRRYDSVNPDWYRAKPNEYLMVCRKNKTRKDLNAKYLESLGATIEYDKEGKIEDVSDIQPIIDNNTKLQVMVVDVRSDKKMNKRGRKSEMPNSGLDMEGFQKSELGNCYYKETDGSLQLFFPYTETSNYEGDIKDISNSNYIKKLANGKDIEIFVPAFAITTEKESGKTVDNIILHDELVNIEYDSLSEQNVQTFYDAFTRGSKKVYIPQKAPRLIGITREDAKNLMEGKPLSKGYVEATSDKVSVDDFTMPVVTVRPEGGLDVLDDIDYLLGLGNFAGSELSEAVGILRNYNMGNQTFGDYEYQGEHKSNDYVDVLKKRVADLWDQNKDWIKTTLENQGIAGENIEDRFYKINAIIYGRVYKVPIVRDEKGEFQYWDGKEGQNDYRIWGSSKWQNKIVTLDDFKQYGIQIENGIGTEGQVYRPQIIQDKGKWVMKMVPVNGRWVQRTTKGRIERRTRKEKEVIDIDAEKMEIERIFNFQFDNNVISEEGFRMQDYKPIAGDGININASLAKTPAELWTSNKKKGTIFEMNPNLTIDQKMNLVDTLKNKLKEKVESYYSILEENELYKPVEVPYNPFMVRKIGTSLERFGIDRIDPSIIDGSETFRTDSIDDAKVGAIINKIYEKYKGARNKDYLQYDPDGELPQGVKREDLFLKRSDVQNLVYSQPEYGNATPEQIEKIKFDESHTPTALQVDYESIMRQIDNIKVASAVDNGRLNGLKANIESFMERVYDIENRENFAGYDNEEFGEGGAFSLNDEGLYSSCEDAENCGG